MTSGMYKLVTLVIVVLAVTGTIIYKVSREKANQSAATGQPLNAQEETRGRENDQLPAVLYFGRFT